MPNWEAIQIATDQGKEIKHQLFEDGKPLPIHRVLGYWQQSTEFTAWWCDHLAENEFPASFWEMPPLNVHGLNQTFEYVLVESPALAKIQADQAPFQQHFAKAANRSVLSFPNLGGDAHLVVPVPRQGRQAYPHLASFTRRAAVDQQLALWSTLSQQIELLIGDKPLWVSTSGLGVYWLHIRLDQRPKYYQHIPYKTPKS